MPVSMRSWREVSGDPLRHLTRTSEKGKVIRANLQGQVRLRVEVSIPSALGRDGSHAEISFRASDCSIQHHHLRVWLTQDETQKYGGQSRCFDLRLR